MKLDFMDDDCDIDGFPLDDIFDCDLCIELNRNIYGRHCDYFGCICKEEFI